MQVLATNWISYPLKKYIWLCLDFPNKQFDQYWHYEYIIYKVLLYIFAKMIFLNSGLATI